MEKIQMLDEEDINFLVQNVLPGYVDLMDQAMKAKGIPTFMLNDFRNQINRAGELRIKLESAPSIGS